MTNEHSCEKATIPIINLPHHHLFTEGRMTVEKALIRHIKHISNFVFPKKADKSQRDYYVNWSKRCLRNLRINRRNDPDRYNKLEQERESLYQRFIKQDNKNLEITYEDLYDRFEEIHTELTTLWQVQHNLPNLFE